MSRSYKKTPYCGDKKDKFFKNYSNRRLRRSKLIHDLQHKDYKKYSCSWNICDYYYLGTTNFSNYYKYAIDFWWRYQQPYKEKPTRLDIWKEYNKLYRRK